MTLSHETLRGLAEALARHEREAGLYRNSPERITQYIESENRLRFLLWENREALIQYAGNTGDFPPGAKLRFFMPGRSMHDRPCTMVTHVHDARYEYVVRLGRTGELWPARRSQLVLDES